jgi:hypothetical protein
MSGRASGCLGTLISLAFFGAIIFGGGVLFRVGGFRLVLGQPIAPEESNNQYLNNLAQKKDAADKAVQTFHIRMGQGKCNEIYDEADEILKRNQSREVIERLCTNQRLKLGSVKSSQQIEWWARPANSTNQYILTRYDTQFSGASAQEVFIWLVTNSKARLVNYEVIPPLSGQSTL